MADPKPPEEPAAEHDLIDTVKTPETGDPAKKIEEIGEPFEGNNA